MKQTHKNIKDIANKRFGKLVAISMTNKKAADGSYFWKCRCDCGENKLISKSKLKNGKGGVISCGCLVGFHEMTKEVRDKISKAHSISIEERTINSKFSSIRNDANRRNRQFSLDKDDVNELIFSSCFYCDYNPNGKKVKYFHKRYNRYVEFLITNGIDRVDNSVGYILSNCVPCCRTCNMTKRNITISMVEKIYEFVHKNYDVSVPLEKGEN